MTSASRTFTDSDARQLGAPRPVLTSSDSGGSSVQAEKSNRGRCELLRAARPHLECVGYVMFIGCPSPVNDPPNSVARAHLTHPVLPGMDTLLGQQLVQARARDPQHLRRLRDVSARLRSASMIVRRSASSRASRSESGRPGRERPRARDPASSSCRLDDITTAFSIWFSSSRTLPGQCTSGLQPRPA